MVAVSKLFYLRQLLPDSLLNNDCHLAVVIVRVDCLAGKLHAATIKADGSFVPEPEVTDVPDDGGPMTPKSKFKILRKLGW